MRFEVWSQNDVLRFQIELGDQLDFPNYLATVEEVEKTNELQPGPEDRRQGVENVLPRNSSAVKSVGLCRSGFGNSLQGTAPKPNFLKRRALGLKPAGNFIPLTPARPGPQNIVRNGSEMINDFAPIQQSISDVDDFNIAARR
jgi:hypothetical protein